jgi:archaellin
MPEWSSTTSKISSFIPAIKENKKSIKSVESEMLNLDSIYSNDIFIVDEKIEDLSLSLSEAEELKSLLFPNQILSFEGDPFVGETQKFSFLETISASNYLVEIIKSSNDSTVREFTKYQKNKRDDGVINTYVFNHKWKNPGSYRIEITPENSCETGKQFSKIINVNNKPEQKLAFKNPTGKNMICPGDTVFFKADQSKWVESWHWELPDGCKYISKDTESLIEVVWGNQPGTIRVYGVGAKGENQISVTTGLLVNVIPKIGSPMVYVDMIDNETINYFEYPSREKLFYTMIDAENEIISLSDSLNSANNSKLEIEKSYKELQTNMNNKISNYENIISDIRSEIFGILIALIGFVLFFSILFTNLWTYMVNFNHFIYDYEQEGIHYINTQISFYKNKNKNQPLLGWTILLLFSFMLIGIVNLR